MSTPPNPQKENTTQRPTQSRWIPQTLLNSKELFEDPKLLSLQEKRNIDRKRISKQIIECFALGHFGEKEAVEEVIMDLIEERGELFATLMLSSSFIRSIGDDSRSNEDNSTSNPGEKTIGWEGKFDVVLLFFGWYESSK
ncbi:hypothetical protein HYALB_00011812 [Hymenoscyphus albidus]|uniref:Uncharacterized protein n=1 Tax=Hymenoscyphus albidus TaxID=595503 RepID=A0A9N9LLN6_9HELO|nr:hypothetical protein HYALB_00011812 [Hymenoscyphus albidus]